MSNFLSWISVTLLWVISAGLWLFRHSCRLRGWQAEIVALICSACLPLWKARDRFLSGTGFQGFIVNSCSCFQHSSHPMSASIIFTSLGNVLRNARDEILCNAVMWYSTLQAIYWTWWFRLAWRSQVTLLKAHSCLYNIIKTKSFTWSQHQACRFSMAAWCHGNYSFTADACAVKSHKK